MKNQRLGELLLEANLIDEIQLKVALKEQEFAGIRLGSALVQLGFVDESVLAAFLSKQTDLPCVNTHGLRIPKEIIDLVPSKIALAHDVLPIRKTQDTLYLAMSDPFDCDVLDMIQESTELNVIPMIAPEFRLRKTVEQYYREDYMQEVEKAHESLQDLVDEIETESVLDLNKKLNNLINETISLRTEVELLKKMIETHIVDKS